jgi:hypothetical protein
MYNTPYSKGGKVGPQAVISGRIRLPLRFAKTRIRIAWGGIESPSDDQISTQRRSVPRGIHCTETLSSKQLLTNFGNTFFVGLAVLYENMIFYF